MVVLQKDNLNPAIIHDNHWDVCTCLRKAANFIMCGISLDVLHYAFVVL